jgi:hypothetical protein
MALHVSTAECTPSASIAELPVMPATTNFVVAMATLAAIEPWIASLDSAMVFPSTVVVATDDGQSVVGPEPARVSLHRLRM